ncbi:MAG: Xaa-Pro peptidase family protein, partial [Rhodanobacter sp.]
METNDKLLASRRHFLHASAISAVALPTMLMGCSPNAPEAASPAGSQARADKASIAALQSVKSQVVPITDNERLERLAKAQKLMGENKIDAIFVGGGTTLSYFVGMHWRNTERMTGMVLPQSGDPIYVTPTFERSRTQEQLKFGKDVRSWEEHESPYQRVAEILSDLHISTGTLGIEEQVPYFRSTGIASGAPNLTLVSATPVIAGCRSIKSPAELALMQLANDATLAVYHAVYQALESGMTQYQVSELIAAAYARTGLAGDASVNIGKYSAQPHGSIEPQHIVDGTVIMLDGGCTADGYASDITRTMVLGSPSDKMKKVFDIVHQAQAAALAAARSGKTMESIDAAARKVVSDSGYGPDYKYFGHRLGHGIGMDRHEWYYLVRGNTRTLEPNMTFSDEPGIYIPEEFGVRLEDCMYIAEDGAHLFTKPSPS